MRVDIAPYIIKLIFEHDTVIIPGLGAFIGTPAGATVDYAGGNVQPPSKTLTFNDNLTNDDGLLIHEIAQHTGQTYDEARMAVETTVAEISSQLNQREIVILQGVGRLYKNYIQKIQFLPDAVNFSRENYGLPPLQFSPITRSREVNEPTSAKPNPAPGAESAPAPAPVQVQKTNAIAGADQTANMPHQIPPASPPQAFENASSTFNPWRVVLIILLLALSGAIGWYVWSTQKAKRVAAEKTAIDTVAETPQTAAPDNNTTETTTQPEVNKPEPAIEKTVEAPAKVEKPAVSKPESTSAVNTSKKSCILVIGIFKDENNITRLSQIVENNGMKVYIADKKNGRLVGAQFNYSEMSDIQRNIGKLQQATGEQNIWIMKK